MVIVLYGLKIINVYYVVANGFIYIHVLLIEGNVNYIVSYGLI